MKGLFNSKLLIILALKKIVMLAILLFFTSGAAGQGVKDIRINEILVKNFDNYEDDYGHRVGWIELFNHGHSSVDIGGARFRVSGKEYVIPKNDPRTKIAPQGYVVFFAEGTASKGTFHTNFTLEETDFIEFHDQGGKGDPISRVEYRMEDMKPDVSIGWYEGDDGKLYWGELKETTPLATNETEEKIHRSEHFRRADPNGAVMAATAMLVVFSALLLLFIVFMLLGKFNIWIAKKREVRSKQDAAGDTIPAAAVSVKTVDGEISGDEITAIAMALYQYSEDLHDIENTILTINRVAKSYSPWSSKIYGLRQTPEKK